MARPERAGRWVVIVTVVAALVFAGWSTFWDALGPLREWGASAAGAVQFVVLFLFFLSGYRVRQRSRRPGGAGQRDGHPHD